MKAIILHDIRSAENVGSLFRTADAIGIDEVYLSQITPTPIDRFGRTRKDIAKTALGAEQSLRWNVYSDIKVLIVELKKKGFIIYALEQHSSSVDYKTITPEKNTAVIVGNEVLGIPQEVLDLADVVIEIPMRGKKESLNVSVATGILLFRLFDR